MRTIEVISRTGAATGWHDVVLDGRPVGTVHRPAPRRWVAIPDEGWPFAPSYVATTRDRAVACMAVGEEWGQWAWRR